MLIGLPGSGKSTFIAAFWHVVDSKEIEADYVVTTYPDDRDYLNNIRDLWLQCKKIERTVAEYREIFLNITDRKTDEVMEFIFPDVSGEMFLRQFQFRKFSEKYEQEISSAEGILLFVNPKKLKGPDLITDADTLLDGLPETALGISHELSAQTNSETTNQEEKPAVAGKVKVTVDFDPKNSQTQIILVDLLQMASLKMKKSCKVCIIVSAWDAVISSQIVDGHTVLPEEWLSKYLPLLRQFLDCHPDKFTVKVYGASAQGGDYDGNIDVLHDFDTPSDRIKVQDGAVLSNNITGPIKWLLNG